MGWNHQLVFFFGGGTWKNIVIALSILDLGNDMVFEAFGNLNLESWEGLL